MSSAENPKKMLNIYILEILKKHSDVNHRLRQQDIIDHMREDYNIICERKAVKRNLVALIEFGYDIIYDNGWYLASRTFEDSEIHLLISSVLFSKSIPTKQCKDLIDKLLTLSNKYFVSNVDYVSNLPELQHTDNKQIFYTIEILSEALAKRKKVSFTYNDYHTDKKLHPRRSEKYIVNPYQIVATNGKYYLIGNYDDHDNISHYRIDRITDIALLDERAKAHKYVQGMKNGLNLPKHMAEHIYMFNGNSVKVKMRVNKKIINDIIDWFGPKVHFSNEDDTHCDVTFRANENAVFYWAMQYGEHIRVEEPAFLQQRIKNTAIQIAANYD